MIVTEPKVFLVGQSRLNVQEMEDFLDEEKTVFTNWDNETLQYEDAEVISETAGRLCYLSFANPRPGGTKAYLDHIKTVGHGSVLEHSSFSFIITDVPLYFTHELVRHRAGTAYSQMSGRYCDLSKVNFFSPYYVNKYMPDTFNDMVETASSHYTYIKETLYDKMMEDPDIDYDNRTIRKIINSEARSVLPQATTTKIFLTANIRALRHMIEMRCSSEAEYVIRQVFNSIFNIVCDEAPNLFSDYEVRGYKDGTKIIETQDRKV